MAQRPKTKLPVRQVHTLLSVAERLAHAKEWRWWRALSRPGARAAFVHLRQHTRRWRREECLAERSPVDFGCGCPDCSFTLFHPGPRGGMAHNIQCAGCGATFWYGPPYPPERIDLVEGAYDLSVTRTLTEITLYGDTRP
jgi:hypothetical protein